MEYILENEENLYAALSCLFVDNKIDYEYIASVAKSFPETDVKYVLFNYVAPVCYFNATTPIPPVWTFFDDDFLITEINKIKKNENSWIKKTQMNIFSAYLKFAFREEWKTLKNLCADKWIKK